MNPHLKTNEWYVENQEIILEGYWPNSGNSKYEDVPDSVKLFTLPDEREFVRDAIIIIKVHSPYWLCSYYSQIDITAQKHQIERSSDDSANTPPGSPSDDSANTPPGSPNDDSANTPPGSPSDDSANTPPGSPCSSSDVTDDYHASLNNGGQQADVNPDPSEEGNDAELYEEGENEEPLDLRIPKRR